MVDRPGEVGVGFGSEAGGGGAGDFLANTGGSMLNAERKFSSIGAKAAMQQTCRRYKVRPDLLHGG